MNDEQQVPPQEAESTVPSVYADLLEAEVPADIGVTETGAALLATADGIRDEIVAYA